MTLMANIKELYLTVKLDMQYHITQLDETERKHAHVVYTSRTDLNNLSN